MRPSPFDPGPPRPADRIYPERRQAILHARCISCRDQLTLESFEDQLSLREYQISGLCQNCQDAIFSQEVSDES